MTSSHEKIEMDKNRLAAFADGELSPEDAAAVVMHLADHPEDQAYVDDLVASNSLLQRAFVKPALEQVPERMRSAIMGEEPSKPSAEVIPFRRRMKFATPIFAGLTAMAAALVASITLLVPTTSEDTQLVAGPVSPQSPLHEILSAQPSGVSVGFGSGELTILSSMPTTNGFCREIEVLDTNKTSVHLALACKTSSEWTVDVAVSEILSTTQEGREFAPASGGQGASLDHWLSVRDAGVALGQDAEAEAISNGWRAKDK